MGDEDFLAAVEADNAGAPADEPKEQPAPEEPAQEPVVDKPRDEQGKFVAKEAAETPQEPPAEPAPAPEPSAPPAPPEAQHAPLAALLDERDKRKAAEDQLRQLREAQAQQQPQAIPDMLEDPEGYTAFVNAQVEQRLYGERLFMSERLNRIEHGAETFQKAKEWGVARCDADPFFNQKVRSSPDPYGVVMEEWKREQAASIPSAELDEFRAWKVAQSQLAGTQPQPPAPPGSPQSAPQNIPPRSLASAPSAGSVLTEVPLSDEDIFEGTIPKRK